MPPDRASDQSSTSHCPACNLTVRLACLSLENLPAHSMATAAEQSLRGMSTAPSLRPSSFFKGSRPVMQVCFCVLVLIMTKQGCHAVAKQETPNPHLAKEVNAAWLTYHNFKVCQLRSCFLHIGHIPALLTTNYCKVKHCFYALLPLLSSRAFS